MKRTKNFFGLAMVLVILFSGNVLRAQSNDYKDGSVWDMTLVKTKTGMGDDYIKSLRSTLKVMYDEAVKQGLILSYKVLQGPSANRDDFDMMLMTEYKNMAATEGQDEKWKAIRDKVIGGEPQEKKLMTDRVEVREIMGSKMMREVIFK